MRELLRMLHVSTNSVRGLRDCNLSIYSGECVLLLGGEFSAKESACAIITGRHSGYAGKIHIYEENMPHYDESAAQKMGIYWLDYRERLVRQATVAENLQIYKKTSGAIVIPWKNFRSETAQILDELHIPCSPDSVVGSLSVYTQFLLSVAKVIANHCHLIVFECDTNKFNSTDLEHLKGVFQLLRSRGISALFTCDKPEGVLELADRVVLMENGRDIKIIDRASYPQNESILNNLEWKSAMKKWPVLSKESQPRIFSTASGGAELSLAGGVTGIFDDTIRSGYDALLSTRDILRDNHCTLVAGGNTFNPGDFNYDMMRKRRIIYVREDSQEYLFGILSCGANLMPPTRIRDLFYRIRKRLERYLETEFFELCSCKSAPRSASSAPNVVKKLISIHRTLGTRPRFIVLESPMYRLDVSDAPLLRSYLKTLNDEGLPILILCKSVYDAQLLCDTLVIAENRVLRRAVSISQPHDGIRQTIEVLI